MKNALNARATLSVKGKEYEIYRLDVLKEHADLERLPYSLKILLENLLRHENGDNICQEHILTLAKYAQDQNADTEIAFTPARVIMQDFTGVPAVVDLAAMRDAMQQLGGDADKINPLVPVELVIDHSVMVDHFGSSDALERNVTLEFERNAERYEFLRWGQRAFDNFKVVPPRTGIVHQVNLEYLTQVVFSQQQDGVWQAYPDTVVGTDSHTTMINGVGVLGWGVGGIEAEAAMLGQPITLLIPEVVGFKLTGKLREGATATDLVLTITQMLRQHGVVGKFVEFFGPGLDHLPLADRATIANMAPEYGATCGIFPVDNETLNYLRLTGRPDDSIALVEAYAKTQGLFRSETEAEYSAVLELDMSTVVPSLAGPKRPQDRISLQDMPTVVHKALRDNHAVRKESATDNEDIERMKEEGGAMEATVRRTPVLHRDQNFDLHDGAVVIAAITSCTNTSNPSVIMGAGLLAKQAVAKGLRAKPWVKTSLAPGSKVVTEYLQQAGLMEPLAQLGFNLVGYGCTTCIGNSGPLPEPISKAVQEKQLAVASVLSGNRNFEGRVHADVKMNFLASPPLVVAYALAGNAAVNMQQDPLGEDNNGNPVYLSDIWPSQRDIQDAIDEYINNAMFRKSYSDVFKGDARWASIQTADTANYQWRNDSTYIQNPPYFVAMSQQPEPIKPIQSARVLAKLSDSITTDHISPAGSIKADSPAGQYLTEHSVQPKDFNSYGSRRGNHQVMMRGTFANVRLRNELAPGTEGGWTRHQPSGEQMFIYNAAMKYQQEGTPLIILAGKEYGAGSSRDWAAKGTLLLGVRAVIVESFERIHRSNLVGMGVLPLQFLDGEDRNSLGLDGTETYDIEHLKPGAKQVNVSATTKQGEKKEFQVRVRIDTPKEWQYYQHGGILHYVLRQLAA